MDDATTPDPGVDPKPETPATPEPTAVMPAVAPATESVPAAEPQSGSGDASSGDTGDGAATESGKRRWLRWLIIIAAVLVIGAVAAVSYNAFSTRLAARGDLERALDLVKEADEAVLAVDDVVTVEITVGLAAAAEEASEQVAAAYTDIEEALGLLDDAYEQLNEEDRLVADALRDAGTARLAMLDEAPRLLDANARAARALSPAGDGMEALLETEELANQATTKFNLQTKEGVTSATQLSSQAVDKLADSRRSFRSAKDAFPEMSIGAFIDYIEAKKALLELGIEIDELWLADKIADANELVEEYNEDDAKVAKLAQELPESETVPIAAAYEDVTADPTERYFEARDEAARADTSLRILLGTEETSTPAADTTATAGTGGAAAGSSEPTPTAPSAEDEFWSHWGWPAATAILGLIFTGLVLSQWLKRRKAHQLAWSIGLLMYAVAAAMEAYSGFTDGWDPTVYRVYIVLAASLVGFLGLGSLYLVTKKRIWGHVFLGYVLVGLAIFLYGTFTVDLRVEYLLPGITAGGDPLGPGGSFPRMMSLWFNVPGSFFLLGGALLSIYRFMPKKEYRYRVWANVLIALGTIVIAGAGGMARAGQTAWLYPAEMVASAMLLAGFLMAGTLEKGAKTIVAKREQEPEESEEAAEPEEPATSEEEAEPESPA